MAGLFRSMLASNLVFPAVACVSAGTFYIPDNVTGGSADVTDSTYASVGGGNVGDGVGGVLGLYFDESITFDIGLPCAGAVLELTRGCGPGASSMHSAFKLSVLDHVGTPLHEFYHFSEGYSQEGSDRVLIPLDGADTRSITVHVERFSDSVGDDATVPAAYLGSLAAVWTVGEVHADEQVLIVDLDPYMYGPCVIENASAGSAETWVRNSSYYGSSSGQCWIALNFSEAVSMLQGPVVMELNGIREPGEGSEPRVVKANGTDVTVISELRLDYDEGETGHMAFMIPGDYLRQTVFARNSESVHPDDWTGTTNNMPFTVMFGNWHGWYARYAKFQGSGLKAMVVDLSNGNFTVSDGAEKVASTEHLYEDNAGLQYNDGCVLPVGEMNGMFSFEAPEIFISDDSTYFLEVLHTRLDSDNDLQLTVLDGETGAVLSNATLYEYEDDSGSTTKSFFYIKGLTSRLINISWVSSGGDDDGILFFPWLVARNVTRTPRPTSTTTTATTTTATTTTATTTITTSTTTVTITTSTTTTSTTTLSKLETSSADRSLLAKFALVMVVAFLL